MAATPREELERIDAALEACKGHRANAAVAIGMEPKRLADLCLTNPYLRAKWGSGQEAVVPSLASEIHRDEPLKPFGVDTAVVRAIDAQDELVTEKGAKLAGFARSEQKFLGGLMKAYAGSVRTAMDFSYAGAVHANGRLVLLLENLSNKLRDIEENPGNYELEAYTRDGTRYVIKGPNEYYKDTADLISKVSGELRKMNGTIHQANEMRLRMKKLEMLSENNVTKVAAWESPAKKADPA